MRCQARTRSAIVPLTLRWKSISQPSTTSPSLAIHMTTSTFAQNDYSLRSPSKQVGLPPPLDIRASWLYLHHLHGARRAAGTALLSQPHRNHGLRRNQLHGNGERTRIQRRRIPQITAGVVRGDETRRDVRLQPRGGGWPEAAVTTFSSGAVPSCLLTAMGTMYCRDGK